MKPEKLLINRILQVIIIFTFVVVTPIFCMELMTFYADRKRFSLRSPTTRWRLPLLGTSLMCLVLISIDGSYEWINWRNNPDGCYVSSGFITMFFVIMKQCLNFFLYDRAKIVHDGLQYKDWRLKFLRWVIFLTVAFGSHVFFAWSYFVNFYGQVSVDGDCIFMTRWPQVIISFAVSDAVLGMSMLLLFAVPLYLETQKASEVGVKSIATKKVKQLMRRNMGISLTIITLDITLLSVMTYFFFNTTTNNDDFEYRILWGNFAAVIDQLVVVIGCHSMTTRWAPEYVRHGLRMRTVRCNPRKRSIENDVETLSTSPPPS